MKQVEHGPACVLALSRPARGAWIETCFVPARTAACSSRAPRGARGLKLPRLRARTGESPSRPARGAWIETSFAPTEIGPIVSRPARGAWIETSYRQREGTQERSRPARGAWIETAVAATTTTYRRCRAPRGARGLKHEMLKKDGEGTRRAPRGARGLKRRNRGQVRPRPQSRPARGAWIETHHRSSISIPTAVAPRAGRVD